MTALKALFQSWIRIRKIKSCHKKLTKKMKLLSQGKVVEGIAMIGLSPKYRYMDIVEAMTLLARQGKKVVILFPNNDIRVLYLSRYNEYAASTSTVEFMQNLEDSVILVPPMAQEYIDEALFKMRVDTNNNQYLWAL